MPRVAPRHARRRAHRPFRGLAVWENRLERWTTAADLRRRRPVAAAVPIDPGRHSRDDGRGHRVPRLLHQLRGDPGLRDAVGRHRPGARVGDPAPRGLVHHRGDRRRPVVHHQRRQEEQEAYNSLHSALPGQLSGQLSLAAAAQPALGAGSLGAVPPGESVPATVAPAEPRPAEVATVEEQPLEPARRTTAGEGRRRTTLVVDAGSELAPRTAAPLAAVGKPLATGDLRASAARRNGSRIPAPYLEASRILDEREDGATLTPENLVEALAAEGVVVDLRTARGLLRELRPAVTALQSLQRPSKASPSGGGAPSGHPAGTANATSREAPAPAQPVRSGAAGKPAPAGVGDRVDTSTGRPIGLVQSPKRSTR